MIGIRGIVVILLLWIAVADNYTIQLTCPQCRNSTDLCYNLDGGPFQNYQLPVADLNQTRCSFPRYTVFTSINVSIDCNSSAHSFKCNDSCYFKLGPYGTQCANSQNGLDMTNALNGFYSLMNNDPTLSTTYDWCNQACGGGLALWVIIVIIVAAVIVIAGVVVGIWWWRKKRGESQDYLNVDSAKNLLK